MSGTYKYHWRHINRKGENACAINMSQVDNENVPRHYVYYQKGNGLCMSELYPNCADGEKEEVGIYKFTDDIASQNMRVLFEVNARSDYLRMLCIRSFLDEHCKDKIPVLMLPMSSSLIKLWRDYLEGKNESINRIVDVLNDVELRSIGKNHDVCDFSAGDYVAIQPIPDYGGENVYWKNSSSGQNCIASPCYDDNREWWKRHCDIEMTFAYRIKGSVLQLRLAGSSETVLNLKISSPSVDFLVVSPEMDQSDCVSCKQFQIIPVDLPDCASEVIEEGQYTWTCRDMHKIDVSQMSRLIDDLPEALVTDRRTMTHGIDCNIPKPNLLDASKSDMDFCSNELYSHLLPKDFNEREYYLLLPPVYLKVNDEKTDVLLPAKALNTFFHCPDEASDMQDFVKESDMRKKLMEEDADLQSHCDSNIDRPYLATRANDKLYHVPSIFLNYYVYIPLQDDVEAIRPQPVSKIVGSGDFIEYKWTVTPAPKTVTNFSLSLNGDKVAIRYLKADELNGEYIKFDVEGSYILTTITIQRDIRKRGTLSAQEFRFKIDDDTGAEFRVFDIKELNDTNIFWFEYDALVYPFRLSKTYSVIAPVYDRVMTNSRNVFRTISNTFDDDVKLNTRNYHDDFRLLVRDQKVNDDIIEYSNKWFFDEPKLPSVSKIKQSLRELEDRAGDVGENLSPLFDRFKELWNEKKDELFLFLYSDTTKLFININRAQDDLKENRMMSWQKTSELPNRSKNRLDKEDGPGANSSEKHKNFSTELKRQFDNSIEDVMSFAVDEASQNDFDIVLNELSLWTNRSSKYMEFKEGYLIPLKQYGGFFNIKNIFDSVEYNLQRRVSSRQRGRFTSPTYLFQLHKDGSKKSSISALLTLAEVTENGKVRPNAWKIVFALHDRKKLQGVVRYNLDFIAKQSIQFSKRHMTCSNAMMELYKLMTNMCSLQNVNVVMFTPNDTHAAHGGTIFGTAHTIKTFEGVSGQEEDLGCVWKRFDEDPGTASPMPPALKRLIDSGNEEDRLIFTDRYVADDLTDETVYQHKVDVESSDYVFKLSSNGTRNELKLTKYTRDFIKRILDFGVMVLTNGTELPLRKFLEEVKKGGMTFSRHHTLQLDKKQSEYNFEVYDPTLERYGFKLYDTLGPDVLMHVYNDRRGNVVNADDLQDRFFSDINKTAKFRLKLEQKDDYCKPIRRTMYEVINDVKISLLPRTYRREDSFISFGTGISLKISSLENVGESYELYANKTEANSCSDLQSDHEFENFRFIRMQNPSLVGFISTNFQDDNTIVQEGGSLFDILTIYETANENIHLWVLYRCDANKDKCGDADEAIVRRNTFLVHIPDLEKNNDRQDIQNYQINTTRSKKFFSGMRIKYHFRISKEDPTRKSKFVFTCTDERIYKHSDFPPIATTLSKPHKFKLSKLPEISYFLDTTVYAPLKVFATQKNRFYEKMKESSTGAPKFDDEETQRVRDTWLQFLS